MEVGQEQALWCPKLYNSLETSKYGIPNLTYAGRMERFWSFLNKSLSPCMNSVTSEEYSSSRLSWEKNNISMKMAGKKATSKNLAKNPRIQ